MTEIDLIQLPYFAEDLDERRKLADEAVLSAREAQGGGGIHNIQLYLLPLLWVEGAWETAGEVVSAADGPHNWFQQQCVQRYRGWLGYAQGNVALAQRAIAAVLADGSATSPGEASFVDALALQRLAATMALDSGDLPTARAWLEAHDRWLEWSGAVLGRAEGALGWAAYHHAAGDLKQARAAAEQALAHASDPRQPLALIAVHRFLGQLDTEAVQFDAAEQHLTQSLALADACVAPFERALTLLEIARLRMAQDLPDDARSLLAEVRAICEPLDAKPTLGKVAALMQELADREVSDA
jgi:tetratricopeptide (TPR) repeat protein